MIDCKTWPFRLGMRGVDRALDSLPCSTAKGSGREPDGVTLQVRFCEESGAELSHGRDIAAPPGNQAANR
jgi:hypothetical protein